jgi:hypothetical protein
MTTTLELQISKELRPYSVVQNLTISNPGLESIINGSPGFINGSPG